MKIGSRIRSINPNVTVKGHIVALWNLDADGKPTGLEIEWDDNERNLVAPDDVVEEG